MTVFDRYARACRRESARIDTLSARYPGCQAADAMRRDAPLYFRRKECERLRLMLPAAARDAIRSHK